MKTILTLLLSLIAVLATAQIVIPGHAHNDYLNRPVLFEALDAGLVSVESDVHFMKGNLYVAHVRPLGRNKKRSLENLYLKPLFERVQKYDGKVYPNFDGPFYLMIDFKRGSVEMYEQLLVLLEPYKSMLTTMEGGILKPGAVTVFLSGSKPTEAILKTEPMLAFIDGRPSDIGKGYSSWIMPVVSDHYKNHLKWNGKGEISDEEQVKLRMLVSKVHAENKLLRLWASPDNPNAWRTFKQIGVDLINTDKPKEFRKYLIVPDGTPPF